MSINSVGMPAVVSNVQINSTKDSCNALKLGIAMLMLNDKKEDDDKLAKALALSALLSPKEVCNVYTSIGNNVGAISASINVSI